METISIKMSSCCFGEMGDDGRFHKRRKKTIVKGIQWFIENQGYSKIKKIHNDTIMFFSGEDTMEIMVDVE